MSADNEWLIFLLSGIGVIVLYLVFMGGRSIFYPVFRRICRKFGLIQEHKYLIEAQHSSIRRHFKATGLNAAGLAGGIILVFSSATFGERFGFWALQAGVWVVVLSIILYLFTEWTACDDDEQIAELTNQQEKERHDTLLKALISGSGSVGSSKNQRLDHATLTFVYDDEMESAPLLDSHRGR